MNTKKLILALFTAALTFTSCSDDEGVNFQPVALGAYENGILVVNQGGYGNGDASVSFISDDLATKNNGIFSFHNNSPLGDVGQSIAFYNNLAYIVLNNSHKIEIVNRYTFEAVATIDTGLDNPRYMTFVNGKGYVTNWGTGAAADDDFIAVIDLSDNTVSSTIAVTEGPEQIIALNNNIYVSHKGGYSHKNTISVINTSDNSISTITVGDVPDEMVLDAANNLWVLCEGIPSWTGNETGGKLMKINTADNTIATTIDFGATDHPTVITLDSGELYYHLSNEIYTMNETDTTLPTTSIISQALTEGDLAIKEGRLYGTRADYQTGDSELVVYDLSDNSLINTFDLNTGAFHIYFN